MKIKKIFAIVGVGLSLSLLIGSMFYTMHTNAIEKEKRTSLGKTKDQTSAQPRTPTQITNPEKTIVLTKLNEKVWTHTSSNTWNGETITHNGLIVSTSKGIVLIDTAWDTNKNYKKTEELLKMIEKHWKKKVVLALITHEHDDSIGGIQSLLNEGIDVRSTLLTAKLAKEQGYPSPKSTLDTKPTMKVGDTIVETFYPGEGHSKDNITVWLPQYKILFGGCFIKSMKAKDLGNLSDANVEQWDDSVTRVIKKYPDVQTVVAGHGRWGDKRLLFHTMDLIEQYTNNKNEPK